MVNIIWLGLFAITVLGERPEIEQCGNWQTSYTKFHSEMLQSNDKKLLVAIPNLSGTLTLYGHMSFIHIGLSDRVIGFTTVCVIAILTNRAFQIGNRKELPLIEQVFSSPHINWTRHQDEDWLIEPLRFKAAIRNYNQSVIESGEYFAVNTLNDWGIQGAILKSDLNDVIGGSRVKTSMMVVNRGRTIKIFENKHYEQQLRGMGMNEYSLFGCIVNYLISPRPEIFDSLKEEQRIMMNPDPDVLKIGIQIRVGDWAWKYDEQPVEVNYFHGYFHCAQQIEDFAKAKHNYSAVYWYLATESKPLRRAAQQAFGSKLITSLNVTLEHSAKESSVCDTNCTVSLKGLQDAAAEWWLLGECDYHVITRYSGYGRGAAMRSLRKNTIYTVPEQKAGMDCTPTSFSDLDTLFYDWSGARV